MDRFEAMSVLVAAAEAGSLSAAGRRLHMPLATVSRKVADLEAHLGARLFVRSSRRLLLTEAGAEFLAASRRILEQLGEAERTAAGEYASPRGDLLISAPIVFGRLHVLPVVAEFLAAFLGIRVRLALSDRLANLVEDQIDLAVRIGPLPDSRLVATTVGHVRSIVCGSPAYLARRGHPLKPEDLAAHDTIGFENLGAAAAWPFREGRRVSTVPIRPRLVVNSAEAATDAAVAGVGVARVLSYQVADHLAAGTLERLLSSFEQDAWPVSLISQPQPLMPQKLRAVLDFATPRLRARLNQVERPA